MPAVRFRHRKLLLLLFALALFLPLLGRRDIVTSHEARVVQTAREMAHAGWPWAAERLAVPGVHLTNAPDVDGKPALRLAPDPDAPKLLVNPWLVPTLND